MSVRAFALLASLSFVGVVGCHHDDDKMMKDDTMMKSDMSSMSKDDMMMKGDKMMQDGMMMKDKGMKMSDDSMTMKGQKMMDDGKMMKGQGDDDEVNVPFHTKWPSSSSGRRPFSFCDTRLHDIYRCDARRGSGLSGFVLARDRLESEAPAFCWPGWRG